MSTKRKTQGISIDPDLLLRAKHRARESHRTLSGHVAHLIVGDLESEHANQPIGERNRQRRGQLAR